MNVAPALEARLAQLRACVDIASVDVLAIAGDGSLLVWITPTDDGDDAEPFPLLIPAPLH
jgi:hypothetical protein